MHPLVLVLDSPGDGGGVAHEHADPTARVAFRVIKAKPSRQRVQTPAFGECRGVEAHHLVISIASHKVVGTASEMSLPLGAYDIETTAVFSMLGDDMSWMHENCFVPTEVAASHMIWISELWNACSRCAMT